MSLITTICIVHNLLHLNLYFLSYLSYISTFFVFGNCRIIVSVRFAFNVLPLTFLSFWNKVFFHICQFD